MTSQDMRMGPGGAVDGLTAGRAGKRRRTTPAAGTPIVVAYAANPEISTSVCLIGYRISAGMIDVADAHVIAHTRDRDAMLRALPADRLTFVGPVKFGNAVRRLAERLFPGRWGLISVLDLPDYLMFDLRAWQAVRRMSRRGPVSYVLRVNPVSFRFPSILPFQDVPVVTGPHNGGLDWPEGFRAVADREGDATGRVRGAGDVLHRIYGDSQRYAAILVANEQCATTVPAVARDRVVIMSENGVAGLGEPAEHRGDVRRLLLVARLNPFKAVDVALRAVARLPEDVTLTIVGDGPEGPPLRALADELGIASRVRFVGHIPHDEVARHYAEAGVFLFPSVRESGGGVVLEAMSYGLPCVVADWGGPAVYTKDVGVQCPVDSPQALEDAVVATLERWLADPTEAREVGDASRAVIAREYVWAGKIERMHELSMAAADSTMPAVRA